MTVKITHRRGLLLIRWQKGDVAVDRAYPRVQTKCLSRVGLRRMIEIDRRHAEQDIDELLYRKAQGKA